MDKLDADFLNYMQNVPAVSVRFSPGIAAKSEVTVHYFGEKRSRQIRHWSVCFEFNTDPDHFALDFAALLAFYPAVNCRSTWRMASSIFQVCSGMQSGSSWAIH